MKRFTIRYSKLQVEFAPARYKWKAIVTDNKTSDEFHSEYYDTKEEAREDALAQARAANG